MKLVTKYGVKLALFALIGFTAAQKPATSNTTETEVSSNATQPGK
jgi:hypothetical protein